jgi:hypothetical protein
LTASNRLNPNGSSNSLRESATISSATNCPIADARVIPEWVAATIYIVSPTNSGKTILQHWPIANYERIKMEHGSIEKPCDLSEHACRRNLPILGLVVSSSGD